MIARVFPRRTQATPIVDKTTDHKCDKKKVGIIRGL